jgi:hypothetical protein
MNFVLRNLGVTLALLVVLQLGSEMPEIDKVTPCLPLHIVSVQERFDGVSEPHRT